MRILKIICLLHQCPAGLERVETMVIHSVMTLIENPKTDYEKSKLKRSCSRCWSMNGGWKAQESLPCEIMSYESFERPVETRTSKGQIQIFAWNFWHVSTSASRNWNYIGPCRQKEASRSRPFSNIRDHQSTLIARKHHIAPCLLTASGWDPWPLLPHHSQSQSGPLENGEKDGYKKVLVRGCIRVSQSRLKELGNRRSF